MKTGSALIRDMLDFEAQDGTLAFWWLGQLGYAVKSKNALIAIDPFLSAHDGRRIPPLLDPDEPMPFDYILGTHDHTDHIDRKVWPRISAASPSIKFIVPEYHKPALIRELPMDPQKITGLNDGTVFRDESKTRTVTGIAAAHERLDRDPKSGLYPSLGYIIEMDGFRIYHSGDCCVYEGLLTALINAGPIDLMFLPINGRDGARYRSGCIGNMDFREAVDLVGGVQPGLAVPGHYEMFENNRENPMAFAEYLEAKYPERPFFIGAHGEKVVIRK